MQLVRTTLRLRKDLKKALERLTVEHDTSLQRIFHEALEMYVAGKTKRKAKRIVFHTHDLGEPLDNLTRADFYPGPHVS
ncbi:hypothetical protein A3A79_03425 [Candidatus Gottesmanbacteria bacterium RIFCSPLOWO2_01_FULL_43_11b]|uniref:Uncharacterized protein n=1 Tax=Candidatus Gottesmanbacteria bacterium RIFCSPLOWO2_01_FULL_43_11b TaxID=1798392 RepID=A0A1F6AIG9_9BACT|nr:MAG: hypothetical protein A3A79_03425 [Candidatus Gottesmanbacteria bacterium RIFCSPLOWO2_01_FULL_43_11b]